MRLALGGLLVLLIGAGVACSSGSGSDAAARQVLCQHLTALQGADQGIASGEFNTSQGAQLLTSAASALNSDATALEAAGDSKVSAQATELAGDVTNEATALEAGDQASLQQAANDATSVISQLPTCQ